MGLVIAVCIYCLCGRLLRDSVAGRAWNFLNAFALVIGTAGGVFFGVFAIVELPFLQSARQG
jgi:hypothetical protein